MTLIKPKIFVDFNNSDSLGRIRLNAVGTVHDLTRLGIVLHEDIEVILTSFELEAEGSVIYSSEEGMWVAVVDWDNIQELPGNRVP